MAEANIAILTVLGKEWVAGPMSIWSLEQCWDDISQLGETGQSLPKKARILAGIAAAAIAGTAPEGRDTPTVNQILRSGGKSYFLNELDKFTKKVLDMSDLFEKPGDAAPPKGEEGATSSMATSRPLSQNLSPEASAAEIGKGFEDPSPSEGSGT